MIILQVLQWILDNYLEINGTGKTVADHRLEAACQWVKSNDKTAISTWNISACGFNYTDLISM